MEATLGWWRSWRDKIVGR